MASHLEGSGVGLAGLVAGEQASLQFRGAQVQKLLLFRVRTEPQHPVLSADLLLAPQRVKELRFRCGHEVVSRTGVRAPEGVGGYWDSGAGLPSAKLASAAN